MNAPSALATRPSAVPPVEEDGEMSLAALLELFGHEDEPHDEPHDGPHDEPHDESPREHAGPGLRAWTQHWLQRASAWGAGPEGSRRAW